METLVIAVTALLVIAACNQLAPKVGLAAPLILLGLGVAVGFLPFVKAIEVPPEIILEVVLPPLLYSTAVAMPVMDFRRELVSVAGLAIGLVVLSTLAIGMTVHLLVPALSVPWAIALGAVLSPTDSVAVSLARRAGVSHRIITILEGEGLFNDASALVLLSAAVTAGIAQAEDVLNPSALATRYLLALGVALVVGWVVGELAVRVRAQISDPTADTVVSFTIPFLASLPAVYLGGSGLVAPVVAGLVVSHHGPRLLPPDNRRTAGQNWRTIELVLEGGVFLVMGLQAFGVVDRLNDSGGGLRKAVVTALIAGAVAVTVRAAFVAPLLAWLRHLGRRGRRRLVAHKEALSFFEERLSHAWDVDEELLAARNLSEEQWERELHRWRARLESRRRWHRRKGADLEYFTSEPLGPREGAVIVWAGMRGAVTLAAAQTLPILAPMRPFFLLVALIVASGSLVVQGLTLSWLIRLVRPQRVSEQADRAERERLLQLLGSAAKETALARALTRRERAGMGQRGITSSFSTVGRVLAATSPQQAVPAGDHGEQEAVEALAPLSPAQLRALAVEAVHAQRDALLDARDEGVFSSYTLEFALERLDAEESMLCAERGLEAARARPES